MLSFGYGVLQQAMTSPPATEGGLSWAVVLLFVALGKYLTRG